MQEVFEFTVMALNEGERLDLFLARQECGGLTRSQIRRMIDGEQIRVNGRMEKPGYRMRAGDCIVLCREMPKEYGVAAENIPLSIVFEDEALVVVNKPPGMVVHPAAGHHAGTLVNALLFHCKDLSGIGGFLRPGIVHRLDKDTSGLMVIAKSDFAHQILAAQFKAHQVTKIYLALVHGEVRGEEGHVDFSVGRHPSDRKKMSVHSRRGKEALTRWSVEERYGVATLLRVRIETGRTHQIRVHMNAIGHPVVGDTVYGNSHKLIQAMREQRLKDILRDMKRQALHAAVLGFTHPLSAEYLDFSVPLPDDMDAVCRQLNAYGHDVS